MRWFLLASLALGGCMKPTAVPQASEPAAVTVAALLETDEAPGAAEVPDALSQRLAEVLSERNLQPRVASLDPHLDELGKHGALERRVALLAEDGTEVLLLVETRARFSVQVNGRYRWNVEADLSLVTDGNTGTANTRAVRVPVALIYSHQDASDALVDAAPLIARQLAGLVDEWIANRG